MHASVSGDFLQFASLRRQVAKLSPVLLDFLALRVRDFDKLRIVVSIIVATILHVVQRTPQLPALTSAGGPHTMLPVALRRVGPRRPLVGVLDVVIVPIFKPANIVKLVVAMMVPGIIAQARVVSPSVERVPRLVAATEAGIAIIVAEVVMTESDADKQVRGNAPERYDNRWRIGKHRAAVNCRAEIDR